jgi:hypothetical protein
LRIKISTAKTIIKNYLRKFPDKCIKNPRKRKNKTRTVRTRANKMREEIKIEENPIKSEVQVFNVVYFVPVMPVYHPIK